jgi:hypothetical protein
VQDFSGSIYLGLKYVHVLAALVFMIGHGGGALTMFRLRAERDPERVRALLDLSRSSLALMHGAQGAMLLAGISAGFAAHWWGQWWIWISLLLWVAITVPMAVLGTRYYNDVRKATGAPWYLGFKVQPPLPVVAAELDAVLGRARPWLLAALGFATLAVILYLMMFKPF